MAISVSDHTLDNLNYNCILWDGKASSDIEISKHLKQIYPSMSDVNILHQICDNSIIRNQKTQEIQFIVQTSDVNGMNEYCTLVGDIINALKHFPKCLRQNNSRGLGLEFGFYSFAGPDNKNGANMQNGVCKPLLRKPTIHPKTQHFQNEILTPIAINMWNKTNEIFPEHCRLALDRTPEKYRYPKNTGFSKITVAHNNGTPYHYDKNNLHGSMTAILILCDDDVVGGEQIIKSDRNAIIIKTVNGLLIIGDYTHMKHAVFPIINGNRIAIIAYSMEKVYQYCKS